MILRDIFEEDERYYNFSDWKKAAKKKGYTISPAQLLAGDGKAKMYYAYDPKNANKHEIAGQMIDWGKGYCNGNL